jgi:uncharacterized membrane protein
MLLALIEPMFETAFELMDRLGAARNVDEWAAALDWTLGAIVDHVSFFRLIQRVGAARATTCTYLVPLFGVGWGWLLLAETPTLTMLVAGALILGSVIVSQRAAR